MGTKIGIPYAEPPVGDLRWRPPVKWKSTKEISAKDWAPNCLQDNSVRMARHGAERTERARHRKPRHGNTRHGIAWHRI